VKNNNMGFGRRRAPLLRTAPGEPPDGIEAARVAEGAQFLEYPDQGQPLLGRRACVR
jgi:hypothetical protein